MKKAGKSLSWQAVQNYDKPLYMAAIHRFQSWSLAVRAAEIDYSKIRRRRSMTLEQIKSEILGLFQKGEDLAYSNMREKHQYLLAARNEKAGRRQLGRGSPEMRNKAKLPSGKIQIQQTDAVLQKYDRDQLHESPKIISRMEVNVRHG